jgi:hypothetical protein
VEVPYFLDTPRILVYLLIATKMNKKKSAVGLAVGMQGVAGEVNADCWKKCASISQRNFCL